MKPGEAFYLVSVIFILAAGVLHFVLLILKVERQLNISYLAVTVPALVAYGLGAFIFLQISIYWFLYRSRWGVKGLAFFALFVLALGSFATQLMLALKFDLINDFTFGAALTPFLIVFVIASVLFIINVYALAHLGMPFFTKTRS